MKQCIVILIFALCQLNSYSQNLIDKYKSGKVRLVPDETFAQNNDWKVINPLYKKHNKTIGTTNFQTLFQSRKSILKLSNGDILTNLYLQNPVIFSASGQFKKELFIEKSDRKTIIGQLDENTLFSVPEKYFKSQVYDLDGKNIKELTFEYSPIRFVPLQDNTLLILSWEIVRGNPRYFIELKDCKANTSKILWEENVDTKYAPFVYQWQWKSTPQPMEIVTMPYAKSDNKGFLPIISQCNDELIIALPKTGEIRFYDHNGKYKYSKHINWQNDLLSVEEQKIIQQKAIDDAKARIDEKHGDVMRNIDTYKKVISEMEEDLKNINTPIPKPAFTNIIKDSDGNLLFFTIPKEKGDNRFYVYVFDDKGEFKTDCTFICDEYELSITSKKMYFDEGYLYSVQKLKKADTNPYRLVRFKLVAEL